MDAPGDAPPAAPAEVAAALNSVAALGNALTAVAGQAPVLQGLFGGDILGRLALIQAAQQQQGQLLHQQGQQLQQQGQLLHQQGQLLQLMQATQVQQGQQQQQQGQQLQQQGQQLQLMQALLTSQVNSLSCLANGAAFARGPNSPLRALVNGQGQTPPGGIFPSTKDELIALKSPAEGGRADRSATLTELANYYGLVPIPAGDGPEAVLAKYTLVANFLTGLQLGL